MKIHGTKKKNNDLPSSNSGKWERVVEGKCSWRFRENFLDIGKCTLVPLVEDHHKLHITPSTSSVVLGDGLNK